MEMFWDAEGLESCTYSAYYDHCTGETDMESCWAEITLDGEVHEGNCAEMEDMFYHNDDYYYDDWCEAGEWDLFEDDCMHMFEGAEGLESCWYEEWIDTCTGDSDDCYAWISFDGE